MTDNEKHRCHTMHSESCCSNHRFAWLTPLAGQLKSNGPWLLAEDKSDNLPDSVKKQECRRMTQSGLLKMLSDVAGIAFDTDDNVTQFRWQSHCGRFAVSWHSSDGSDTRLFEQRAEDYFSRLELIIDEQLLAAFQEPLWPHLQTGNDYTDNTLSIPVDCLDALQAGVLASAKKTGSGAKGINAAAA